MRIKAYGFVFLLSLSAEIGLAKDRFHTKAEVVAGINCAKIKSNRHLCEEYIELFNEVEAYGDKTKLELSLGSAIYALTQMPQNRTDFADALKKTDHFIALLNKKIIDGVTLLQRKDNLVNRIALLNTDNNELKTVSLIIEVKELAIEDTLKRVGSLKAAFERKRPFFTENNHALGERMIALPAMRDFLLLSSAFVQVEKYTEGAETYGIYLGSGFFLEKPTGEKVFITASHVVDTDKNQESVVYIYPAFDVDRSGKQIESSSIARVSLNQADYLRFSDPNLPYVNEDYAGVDLIEIPFADLEWSSPPEGISFLKLRDLESEPLAFDELLFTGGYPSEEKGKFKKLFGLFKGFQMTVSDGAVLQFTILSDHYHIHGNSGGPIVDQAGRVVGVVISGASQDQYVLENSYLRVARGTPLFLHREKDNGQAKISFRLRFYPQTRKSHPNYICGEFTTAANEGPVYGKSHQICDFEMYPLKPKTGRQ